MDIHPYDGDRDALRPLFREAEDSQRQLDRYLGLGEVLVAVEDSRIVGHIHLIHDGADTIEIRNMAVDQGRRGHGIGRALVEAAARRSREQRITRLTVATAAADIGNLRFYQRQGFRLLRVERDAFGPDSGYDDIVLDGIPLRDQVWFDREL